MKKVGIIGTGIVGQTLAKGFIKHGYQALIGTRDPGKLVDWKSDAGDKGLVGSVDDAVDFSDLVVLSVKGTAARQVISQIGNGRLQGKTVIDSTNPIADAAPVNGVLQFFNDINKSLMEQLQQEAPNANFVKAFSCIGSAHMVNPEFETKPSMFICGNNLDAKKQVSEILDIFGFEVEDMGTMEAARAIEPLAMLWCIPGFTQDQWNHAFKLLKI